MSRENMPTRVLNALFQKHGPVVSAHRCDGGVLIERVVGHSPSGHMTEKVFVPDEDMETLIGETE